MPSAISTSSLASRLGFLVFVICQLRYQTIRHGARKRLLISLKPPLGDIAEGRQFVVLDIVAFALGEPKQKHRARLTPLRKQHAEAARPPMTRPRHALLDDTAAQIGIDEAAFCPPQRPDQVCVGNPLAAREARELLRPEYPQAPLPYYKL